MASGEGRSIRGRGGVWARQAAAGVVVAVVILLLWQTADAYRVYKALHVLFAVIWAGGIAALLLTHLLSERSGGPRETAAVVKYGSLVGLHVFTPAALAVFGFGVAMVEKAGWGWGLFWIDFALAVFAISYVGGALYLGPIGKRIGLAYRESRGEVTPAIVGLQRRLLHARLVDAVLLLLVVLDMSAKPTF